MRVGLEIGLERTWLRLERRWLVVRREDIVQAIDFWEGGIWDQATSVYLSTWPRLLKQKEA
jgi:hypothetical protein